MSPPADEFSWFLDELEQVRTVRFHVVERRPTRAELRAGSGGSFTRFRELFGTCRLYRQRSGGHLIGVHEPLRNGLCELIDPGGELLQVAASTGAWIFLPRSHLVPGASESLHAQRGFARRARPLDVSFADWLKEACGRARRKFTKREWKALALDTTLFTPEEEAIVAARRLFDWRVEESSELRASRRVRFHVTNRSDVRLPYLSVDVRGVDISLEGRHSLKVDHIGPGKTGMVEVATYDQALYPWEPDKIHRWSYVPSPEPLPEDKHRYWEFGTPP